MNQLQIEVADVELTGLREKASTLGVSVEEVVKQAIRQHLQPNYPVVPEDVFLQALADTVAENNELYRRLAQ